MLNFSAIAIAQPREFLGDISDKGVTGTMVWKGVLAISKEALASIALKR
jgi:hypothetical protein